VKDLREWLVEQRWFASKGTEVSDVEVLEQTPVGDDLKLSILQATFPTGTHELYQVFLDGSGEEATPGRGLLELMHRGDAVGELRFVWLDGPLPEGESRPLGVEQSNSSIVFGDASILKVLRRLEPGDNPELELLRFLSAHGFEHIAPLQGWYEHEGRLIDATLGILQRYEVGARDGWELAVESVRSGGDFLVEARELGVITGQLHSALGSDFSDSHFAPEEAGEEGLALLVATVDEEIERVFRDLPDDGPAAAIAHRGQDVRELAQSLSHVGVGGLLIRTHGDYHLGQILRAPRGWVVLDFEGEPARSLPERRRKRSPLRDVAGMLRSFAYAATAASAPDSWEPAVRAAYLEGYMGTVDASLLPPGQDATNKLLAIFELEKAVYELRYEINHRPDWVGIPVAGIARLLDEAYS
jgi:maltokinase